MSPRWQGMQRFYVMGERAVEEKATPEEVEQIAQLAGQSVREGAVGFSINRLKAHRLPDGRCIPGTPRPSGWSLSLGSWRSRRHFTERNQRHPVAKEMDIIRGLEAAGTHMLLAHHGWQARTERTLPTSR